MSSAAAQRLQVKQPVTRSPRLSISISSCPQLWQRSMPPTSRRICQNEGLSASAGALLHRRRTHDIMTVEMPERGRTQAALMLLFVPPLSFEEYGEHPYDPSGLSHLLAGVIMIVSIGALTLDSLSRVVDAVGGRAG